MMLQTHRRILRSPVVAWSPIVSRTAVVARPTLCRSSFPRWSSILEYLEYSGVRSISVDNARERLATEDAVLLDVRPLTSKQYFIQDAVQVPIFEVVDLRSLRSRRSIAQAVAHLVNGVTPMQINERFAEQVSEEMEALPYDPSTIIVCCESALPSDKESRSLKAAWKLCTAGVRWKVLHLNGGTKQIAE